MIWIVWIHICSHSVLHHGSLLLLLLLLTILGTLKWSESTCIHFGRMNSTSLTRITSCSWRGIWLLLASSCFDMSFSYDLLSHWILYCLPSRCIILAILTLGSTWEEWAFCSLCFLISTIECIIFVIQCVIGTGCTCSDTSNMSCICGITIFTFNWFHYRIIQVDDKIFIDCVFIRRFWFSDRLSTLVIVTSSLCASVISSNSIIRWLLLLLSIITPFHYSSMLDCLIIYWIISSLHILTRWADELIY